MNTERRLIIGFGGAAGAALLFLLWIFLGFGAAESTLPLDNGIWYTGAETFEGDVRVLSFQVPEAEYSEGRTLLFKTTHTRVEVLAGETVVYRYGWEEGAPSFLKSPGTLWHLVTIPAGHQGESVRLRIYPVYQNFYGSTDRVFCSSRGGCEMELVKGILPILIINCIIVFAGLLSIFLHFVTRSRREKHEIGSFLCLGFFSLTIVVWSLCQCGFLQFLIPDGRTLYFVDFFSFFLFPVPFNLFVYTICQTKCRKGFAVLSAAYLAEMAVAVAIQLTGWLDIFQMISVTHVTMAVNVVYVFWAVNQETHQTGNQTAKRFRLPLYIVILFGFAELVVYYLKKFRGTSIFLPLGTITFIAMLVWIQVSQYYRAMLEEQKLAYFEKLANMDILTEALNRNAYENTLRRLEQQELEVKATCVVLFDINNMKQINDNFGHEKGDEALKSCYHCICRAFDKDGKCFRIGGDEFVYLSSKRQDLAGEAAFFEQLIDQESHRFDFPFGVSLGFASYDPERDSTIRDVIRRSDIMMYENKKKKGVPVRCAP